MELIEILAILILLCVLTAIALLAVLLLRKPKETSSDPAALAEATARAMADTMRREVTDPILREEKNSQSTLRTELQNELRGSRTETSGAIQTLGQTLRESQKETAELQAKRISDLTESERALMAELADAQSRRFEAQVARI